VTPRDGSLAKLVHGNAVVVREDFLKAMHVKVGDEVSVATNYGQVFKATVNGVIQNTPPFFDLSDSPMIVVATDAFRAIPSSSNRPLQFTSVYVDVPGHSDAAIAALKPRLQSVLPLTLVHTAREAGAQDRQSANDLHHYAQLAGLLGLLIGGLGIGNTISVLLRRRSLEIAMLKTLGYRQRSLLILFGLEVGLIGLIGGIIGSFLGIALSFAIKSLLEQFVSFSLPTILDPLIILSGVGLGLCLALIFGLRPIIQASQVRPLMLLRGLAGRQRRLRWLTNLLLLALVVILLFILAQIILNDLTLTFEVVVVMGILLLILGLFFRLLVSGLSRLPVSRLLPFIWQGHVQLAQRNVGRQGWRSVITSVALFFGVLTFGLVFGLGQNFQNRSNVRLNQLATYQDNASLSVGINEKAAVDQQLQTISGVKHVSFYPATDTQAVTVRNVSPATLLQQASDDQKNNTYYAFSSFGSVQGYDLAHNQPLIQATLVQGDQDARVGRKLGPADAGTSNALVPYSLSQSPINLKLGDQFTIRNPLNGVQATLTVVGFYTRNGQNPIFGSILMDQALTLKLAGDNVQYYYSLLLDPDRTDAILRQIQRAAPSAQAISNADLLNTFGPLIANLSSLLELIAALAALAGLVTLANTIALEMLERRRELGILKAIGHTSQSVFSEVLLENGLIGLVGGL